ncbi:rhomboid family intramembrane serine protease [Nocardioides sp.]|uniref:rhomboid family intramembrane serine protease n=1 Tax=Nocardioides sp. TaxID=35761 RepID=UPI002ED2D3AF
MPTCYRHPDRESYIRCQRCDRTICPDCMRDAAVGFQCPSCVAEGTKTTRQRRTAYGGLRSSNPALTSMVLIATNVAVWIAITATGGSSSRLFDWLALRPMGLCLVGPQGGYDTTDLSCPMGGLLLPGFSDGAYWQVVTSMFTHVAVWHIAFNMLALWFLGPQLEMAIGRLRFLALYFLSGLAGSVLVLFAGPEYGGTHGASGAIFGLMGALLVVAFKVGGNVQQIGMWLLLNLVITFAFPNISWQGHVGGFVGGVLIALVLVYSPRERRGTWQLAGLGLIAVALVVALVISVSVLA